MKLWIDPGHGGVDTGAAGPAGTLEKTVNLAVARQLRDLCLNGGHSVRLSRDGDHFMDLAPRADMANEWGADLFLSIHCNASTPAAHGTETFSFPGSEAGARIAREVQARLTDVLHTEDRGVKEANFAVLRLTAMPAVMVELGFLSNVQEEKRLADPAFQKAAACALYTALTGEEATLPAADLSTERAIAIIRKQLDFPDADAWFAYILERDYGDALLVRWAKSYQLP